MSAVAFGEAKRPIRGLAMNQAESFVHRAPQCDTGKNVCTLCRIRIEQIDPELLQD